VRVFLFEFCLLKTVGYRYKEPQRAMNITAKKSTFTGGIPAGFHVVTVRTVAPETASSKNGAWTDLTKQLKVEVANTFGVQTHYFNVCGYKRMEDVTIEDLSQSSQKMILASKPENRNAVFIQLRDKEFVARSSDNGSESYAVSLATTQRVISEPRTDVAINMLAEFAYACGVEEGQDIDIEDLAGYSVGIEVRALKNSLGKPYNGIRRFMREADALVKIEAAANEA
jgi:hypothetical protein